MQIILVDDPGRDQLLPFVFTRPVSEIRCGILTLREKWEHRLGYGQHSFSYMVPDYLSGCFPLRISEDNLAVNAALLVDEKLADTIARLESGQQLVCKNRLLAIRLAADEFAHVKDFLPLPQFKRIEYDTDPVFINQIWDIFSLNGAAIESDFDLLTRNRSTAPISGTNQLIGSERIFLEPGAKVECSVINASSGPVYIGKNAEIMEGCLVRGPFALGQDAVLKMGAKIYGATTVGPGCKVGGEVSNSVIFANSNKAHDGFLGNSVVGEWCNLGADTNNSNLKNNYSDVKVWNYPACDYVSSGLQFCGLFMGDHSKCSINTMFNTGTVAGVCANIFGSGFPPKHIPSFTWGSEAGGDLFMIEKAVQLAEKVMLRRNKKMSVAEKDLLAHLYLMQIHPRADD